MRQITRLYVLGCLDHGPMSGYDIQQILQMNDIERWGGILVGSIYHALKKMEKEGLIEVSSIEHTGHRQKAVYQITEMGREHLVQLIREALKEKSVSYPSSLYAALSFAHKLPAGEIIEALKKQKIVLQQEYDSMETGYEEKKQALNGTVGAVTEIIFTNMFGIIKQQQQMIDQLLTEYEQ